MLTLESLGLTKELLEEKVIAECADRLLTGVIIDEEGDEDRRPSDIARQITKMVKAKVDQAIQELGDKHVMPKIIEHIEGITLQRTNEWGERNKEKPKTFIEYMTERAEAYIREEVNYEGKSKDQANGYSWSKNGTRIAYMIDHHLQYAIKVAIEAALKDVNTKIGCALAKQVQISLEQVMDGLKVTVNTK